jgi:hypothetical protein
LVSQTAFVSFLSGEKVHPLMNRDSERIPRSLLQGDLQFRLLLDFFHA